MHHDKVGRRGAVGARRLLHGDARRVVAAVLEPLEPADENILHRRGAGAANNTAHSRSSLLAAQARRGRARQRESSHPRHHSEGSNTAQRATPSRRHRKHIRALLPASDRRSGTPRRLLRSPRTQSARRAGSLNFSNILRCEKHAVVSGMPILIPVNLIYIGLTDGTAHSVSHGAVSIRPAGSSNRFCNQTTQVSTGAGMPFPRSNQTQHQRNRQRAKLDAATCRLPSRANHRQAVRGVQDALNHSP